MSQTNTVTGLVSFGNRKFRGERQKNIGNKGVSVTCNLRSLGVLAISVNESQRWVE